MQAKNKIRIIISWLTAMVVISIMAAQYVNSTGLASIWILAFLFICLDIILLIRFVVCKIENSNNKIISIIKTFLLLAVFGGAIVYRCHLLNTNTYFDENGLLLYNSAAQYLSGVNVPAYIASDAANYIFVYMIAFFMRFIGIKIEALYVLQICLQILTIFFVYLASKKLTNQGAGIISAVVLAFSPMYVYNVFSTTKDNFIGLIIAFQLFLICSLFGYRKNDKYTKSRMIVRCVLVAIIIISIDLALLIDASFIALGMIAGADMLLNISFSNFDINYITDSKVCQIIFAFLLGISIYGICVNKKKDKETETHEECVPDIETEEQTVEDNTLKQVDELPGMIHNPLPLPVRKAHVEMDYSEEISDDDDFDITVSESDDFDI